jgi:adenine-specific DNA-methyltransferase
MNYIGSKLKLSSFIQDTVEGVVGIDLKDKVFCDIFAGTSIIGRVFKSRVKKVISNDLEYFSYILSRNYIGNNKEIPNYRNIIESLNEVESTKEGFIYQNYCLGSGSGRQYFSDENGKKIDAIREVINRYKGANPDIYFFLLASLLESSDKVANTASIYGAFLKELKRTARKPLILEPALFEESNNLHEIYHEDSNTLIKKIEGDILYLDPPYNARQYGANYHLLTTIARYDTFIPKGKTGLREYFKSDYCTTKKVSQSFEKLIREANFKYIFLSYNNEGLMSEDLIKTIMSRYGRYNLVKKKYQRFKADKTENRNHKAKSTYEYLHILEKY